MELRQASQRDCENWTQSQPPGEPGVLQEYSPSSVTCSTSPVIRPCLIACSCSFFAVSFSFATALMTRPSSVRISKPHTAAWAGTGNTYFARGVAAGQHCQNVWVSVTVADTDHDIVNECALNEKRKTAHHQRSQRARLVAQVVGMQLARQVH